MVMPTKNIVKQYVENGVYHIYNRGVEKLTIFLDDRDYKTFLYFPKQYLIDENDPEKDISHYKGRTFVRRSFYKKVDPLAYCLMPGKRYLYGNRKLLIGLEQVVKIR